ncbi:MAG: hypothetical protein BWK80_36585 [Desulfobacteraceae bacterium IS3]|nr:MAG: hypothetical protein BWK80_36585 [Desulfobacteraceae bacterium IS3]
MKKTSIFLKILLVILLMTDAEQCFSADDIRTKLQEEFEWLKAETLVWSASKHEQKTSEAPSLTNVIRADEIKKFGYRTMADILSSVSGFYTTYDRSYHYLGVRGFGLPGDFNSRILLLIDGQRINDNVYGQAPVGTDFPLDTDLIDRVEITRGPGSCLYGTNAFFAVINVITKKGRDINGSQISGEAGSLNTYNGRYSFGKKLSADTEMLLSGTVYSSRGQTSLYYKEFDDPATNNGIAENLDDDLSKSLFGKMSFQDFTLSGIYIFRDKDRPASSWGTAFNKSFNAIDERGYAQLRYEHSFDNHIVFSSNMYYSRYVFRGNYPADALREDQTPYLNYNKENDYVDTIGGEISISRKLFQKHYVSIGAEYQYSDYDSYNYDADPYQLWYSERLYFSNWACYIQDEFRVSDSLILSAGLRYDRYESFGGTSNPRVSLIYSPFDTTTFKFIYGTAFRSPSYYESGINTQNNGGELHPEKISTYEMIAEQRFGKHLQGFVSGFMYKIDGLITETEQGDIFIFANTDDIEAKGLEAELQARWENGIKASMNYTFQDVMNNRTDESLSDSPRHLIKGSLAFPLMEKVFGSVQGQYIGTRKTKSGEEASGFFTMNAALSGANIVKGLDISASVYNLFDKLYEDPVSTAYKQDVIEQNGRAFRLKLTYSF